MASVSPTSADLPDATEISPQRCCENCWKPCAAKLLSGWKQMQVSYYGGKYSIQRLLALDEYTRNASLLRVVLVCAGTPLPMVALVFIQESIPLQNPLDGWSANYGFWIRAVVFVWAVINGVMVEATYVIDDFHVTVLQLALLSVCVSIGVTALTMLTASILVFPIPFFVLSTIPIFYCILMISFRLIMGSAVVRKLIASRDQVVQYIKLVVAETSPVGIFPMYEILFRAAGRAGFQLPVIMLLPLVKLLAKNVVLRYTRGKEDMVPVEVIFTVDFFNALYVSTCMQSATSLTSVMAITLADLVQTLVMLYGLRRRTGSILSRLEQAVDTGNNSNILTMIRSLCCDRESYEKQSQFGIRTHSSMRLQLSPVSQSVLDSLDAIPSTEAAKSPKKAKGRLPFCTSRVLKSRQRAILPFIPREAGESAPSELPNLEGRGASRDMLQKHHTILRETLGTVFTTECIILTAYLEAFIPFFYSSYMLVMVHLPSALYHSEMADITQENVISTVTPLLVFGLVQIGTFTMLAAVIRRNCGMSALYQLAFVLEAHMPIVQCKLLLWMIITLCFRIKHFGVDFTFEFIRLGFPRLWSPP